MCSSRSTWKLGRTQTSQTTHVHRRSPHSQSSTLFTISYPFSGSPSGSVCVDGRRPEVQLQIQFCCSGNGRTVRRLLRPHLTCLLFCSVRDGRTDGQRPSLFFLLNSAPSPTDRQEKGGGETDRPKQQPVSLFRRSRAPATLARILSFSSASAAPPCPPTYGAVCRQQAIKEASAGGSGSARAPVSNA